ncbi:hypothetical protein ACS2TL_26985 [Bacillus cereus group sp. BC326]
MNTRSDSITLSDGTTYSLPEGIEAESVKSWREGQDQIFF